MTQARTTTVKIMGGHSFQLEDLRWLIEQTKSLPDDAQIRVTYYKADSRDTRESDSATLSVEVPA